MELAHKRPRNSNNIKKESFKNEKDENIDNNRFEEFSSENYSSSDEEESFDEEYALLGDILNHAVKRNKKRQEKEKQRRFISFKNNKRKKIEKENNYITFNERTKAIENQLNLDPKELEDFLEKCTVKFVTKEEIEEKLENPKIQFFDPDIFVKENILDSYIKKSENSNLETKEEEEFEESENYEIKTEIDNNIDSTMIKIDEKYKIKENFIKLRQILENKFLDNEQRKWLYNFIESVNEKKLEYIMEEIDDKDKKLNIILDLDNTCIFSRIISPKDKYKIEKLKNIENKEIYYLNFEYNKQILAIILIIREGLKEFIDYIKPISNFHIYTASITKYGLAVKDLLEEYLDIKFQKFQSRTGNDENSYNKYLSKIDMKSEKIKNVLIFDDQIIVWRNDFENVIVSKKFFDEELNYMTEKENVTNLKQYFIDNYRGFSYNSFIDKKQKSDCSEINFNYNDWKRQLTNIKECKFYEYYNDENDKIEDYNYQQNKNYFGEYLDSKNLQLLYMMNVVKILYTLVYLYDLDIVNAIKLVRFNSLYGMKFDLSYIMEEKQKNTLEDMIMVCGGTIYNEKLFGEDDKVFYVCSNNIFIKKHNEIMNKINDKICGVLKEKFIIDSYYFMTNIKDRVSDDDYCFN